MEYEFFVRDLNKEAFNALVKESHVAIETHLDQSNHLKAISLKGDNTIPYIVRIEGLTDLKLVRLLLETGHLNKVFHGALDSLSLIYETSGGLRYDQAPPKRVTCVEFMMKLILRSQDFNYSASKLFPSYNNQLIVSNRLLGYINTIDTVSNYNIAKVHILLSFFREMLYSLRHDAHKVKVLRGIFEFIPTQVLMKVNDYKF